MSGKSIDDAVEVVYAALAGCFGDFNTDHARRAVDALTAAGYAVVKLPEPADEEPFDEGEGYGTKSFNWGQGSTVLATFPNGRVWDEDADLDPDQAHELAAALLAAEIATKMEVSHA